MCEDVTSRSTMDSGSLLPRSSLDESSKPKWRRRLVITGCSVLISACTGGNQPAPVSVSEPASSEPPEPSQPNEGSTDPIDIPWSAEGVYTGVITSDVIHETRSLVAFADSWGFTRFITEKGHYIGLPDSPNFPLSGIAATGHTWPDGSSKSTFTFDRIQSASFDLEGIYSGGGDQGKWSLDLEPRFTRYPDEGLYVLLDDLQNIKATLEIAGGKTIYGSNVDGCVFNGTIARDGWTFQYIYDVSITVENCPQGTNADLNGDYAGMGGLTPDSGSANRLLLLTLGVSNDERALTLVLEKL